MSWSVIRSPQHDFVYSWGCILMCSVKVLIFSISFDTILYLSKHTLMGFLVHQHLHFVLSCSGISERLMWLAFPWQKRPWKAALNLIANSHCHYNVKKHAILPNSIFRYLRLIAPTWDHLIVFKTSVVKLVRSIVMYSFLRSNLANLCNTAVTMTWQNRTWGKRL